MYIIFTPVGLLRDYVMYMCMYTEYTCISFQHDGFQAYLWKQRNYAIWLCTPPPPKRISLGKGLAFSQPENGVIRAELSGKEVINLFYCETKIARNAWHAHERAVTGGVVKEDLRGGTCLITESGYRFAGYGLWFMLFACSCFSFF